MQINKLKELEYKKIIVYKIVKCPFSPWIEVFQHNN